MHSSGEFQSVLVVRWFVGLIHWLFWDVGCAWGNMMINILLQELVGGGFMDRPPNQILYGDNVLPLSFRT